MKYLAVSVCLTLLAEPAFAWSETRLAVQRICDIPTEAATPAKVLHARDVARRACTEAADALTAHGIAASSLNQDDAGALLACTAVGEYFPNLTQQASRQFPYLQEVRICRAGEPLGRVVTDRRSSIANAEATLARPVRNDSVWREVVLYGGVGVTAAVLVAGTVLLVKGHAEDDLAHEMADTGRSTSDVNAHFGKYRSYTTSGVILAVSGAAILAGSLTAWFLWPSNQGTAGSVTSLGATPLEGGMAVAISGRF